MKKLKTLNLTLAVVVGVASATSAYGVVINVHDNFDDHAVSGNTGTAYFSKDPFRPTGTGVINPFLRIQARGVEQGMNTSAVKNYLDNKQPVDGFTRDLPLANLATVEFEGNTYYNFFLDVNQTQNGLISLVDLRIWISPQLFTAAELDALRGTDPNVWGMNAGYDIQIASANGSGSGDMTVLVPVPANPGLLGDYVYLYSQFGGAGGAYGADAGFEEWRAFTRPPLPPPSVPDGGATLVLLGTVMAGFAALRRKSA